MSTKPLGIRSNNPGNIERGANWQGLAPVQPHARFATFTRPEFGIRAIALTILTYFRSGQAADGSRIDTIREVIARWAPGFENDTSAYVAHVDELHPATADQVIDLSRYENLMPLVVGIIRHENGKGPLPGGHWYPQSVIDEGLRLAKVLPPTRLDPVEIGAATAAGGAGAAGVTAAVVEHASSPAAEVIAHGADMIDNVPLPGPAPDMAGEALVAAQQGLGPLAHLSIWIAVALAVLAVALIVHRLRRKRDRQRLEAEA